MSDQSIKHHGSCLCGAVRITVGIASRAVAACHCRMCRKWGGGPLLAVAPSRDIQFEGEAQVAVFDSSEWAERGFCRNCGTHLFYRLKASGECAVPVGLLDESEAWRFDEEIFVEEQPAYYAFANETRCLSGAEVFAQYGATPD